MKVKTKVKGHGRLIAAALPLLAAGLLISLFGCSSSSTSPDPILGSSSSTGSGGNGSTRVAYRGTLTLTITNAYPAFTASLAPPISVTILENGQMNFTTGYVNWDATDENPQTKIHWSGSMTISPRQNEPYSESRGHIAVWENTRVSEHIEFWIRENGEWSKKIDEYPAETWNGGLVFSMDEALDNGAVLSTNEVTVEGAHPIGSVTWTLYMAQAI
jgi:hypothetical protein